MSSQSDTQQAMFATTGHGLAHLLRDELEHLGATDIKAAGAGVRFHASLANAYAICLHSRIANRVLLPIHRGKAEDADALYRLARSIDWLAQMSLESTFAIDFYSAESGITHTRYGALKFKDAIVDQFREATGDRPSVERLDPDLRINVYVHRDQARIALDWSGRSLHQRGYRIEDTAAPLKENLAAAMLQANNWPQIADQGKPLLDPMCGSGTLLIEAAMMACDVAPGLFRQRFGFTGWNGHQPDVWQQVLDQARQRAENGKRAFAASDCEIRGQDKNSKVLSACRENLEAAGFDQLVSVEQADFFADSSKAANPLYPLAPDGIQHQQGLITFNPPYGERLCAERSDPAFYRNCARVLQQRFSGWTAGILVPQKAPHHLLRIQAATDKDASANRKYSGSTTATALQFGNGGIPCRLVAGVISTQSRKTATPDHSRTSAKAPQAERKRGAAIWDQGKGQKSGSATTDTQLNSEQGLDFANRLKKNRKKLANWVKREQISAYRVYDADIPEFAVAIDIYTGAGSATTRGPWAQQADTIEYTDTQTHVVVQEYRAPATISEQRAAERLQLVLKLTPEILGIEDERLHLKVRQRQKGTDQYQRRQHDSPTLKVNEYGCEVLVNPGDYLDTGLFLDHRNVRRYIQQNTSGKRFLNLFCYTATATAQAIVGNAGFTVSVDSSKRYLEWAKSNLQMASSSLQQHHLVRADVMTWLRQSDERFDLILLDPPTFSNSTEFDHDWDVQRHHVECIKCCLDRMPEDGLIIFSTNFRRFKLSPEVSAFAQVEERSDWSIGPDFARNRKIHRCWFIRPLATSSDN